MYMQWLPPRSGEGRRSWRTALALTVACALLTVIARFVCTDPLGNVGFWPSNGALVVAWLVLPWRYGIAVSVVSLGLNIWINSFFNYTLFQNVLYAGLNIEVSLVTAVLTKRFCGAAIDLSRLKRFATFALCAGLACASEAALGEFFNGVTAGYTSIVHEWMQWALSDTIGLLISTPAMLFATRYRTYAQYFPISNLESLSLLGLTIASGCWAFVQPTSSAFLYCYPVLILSVIASAFTAHGLGPLVSIAGFGLVERQESLQPFLVSLLLAGLPSNNALGERNRNAVRLTRLHRSARLARSEAVAASRAKSDFIANISHEIRTPLNGILGMTDVLIAQARDPDGLAKLRIVQESGQGLLAVLNDILDISKIESGKITIEPVDFALEGLIDDAFATFRALADRKGLAYSRTIADDVRGHYCGDESRIRQILNNLISNAMKFTDAGGVSLTVSRRGDRIAFAVSDTGIGIAHEHQEQLFQRFSQVDTSTTRRYGGTGLGLAISCHFAALMDGEIQVTSEPGQGSCFTLCLPLPRSRTQLQTMREDGQIEGVMAFRPGLRILAAEDNRVNQQVLAAILLAGEVDLTLVSDGRQAVDTFASHPFDLILMDMLMPVMDGSGAISEIRSLERAESRRRTPVLVLTANAMQHQLEDYGHLDIDGVVAKPIKVDLLFGAIARALPDVTTGRPA